MLYGYNNKSTMNLYNVRFYVFSCFMNLVSILFSIFTIPEYGIYMGIMGFVLYSVMIYEALRRHQFTDDQYRVRYSIKVLAGIALITMGVFTLHSDFLLYLPILMGLLYLNLNTIIRYTWLQYVIIAFMLSPVVRVVLDPSKNKMEYISIIFLFVTSSLISTMLFHTNKETIEENENRANMIKNMFRIMNHLTVHNVRNELQEMQRLYKPEYRNNGMMFLTAMTQHMESIDKMVNNRLFDSYEDVMINDVVDDLNHVLRDSDVEFESDFDNEEMNCNKSILFTTIKNFVENSIEASKRNGIKCELKISKRKNMITIIDNAGGFDIEKIGFGKTEKNNKNDHGIFLRTMIDPSVENIFGFKTTITKISGGTKVILTFKEKK
jgi:uncharacterized membrane protein